MKKNLLIAAMGLLTMASCTNDEEVNNLIAKNDNAISFDTYVGKATKAPIDAFTDGDAFGVYAFSTGQEAWTGTHENSLTGATPNFMLNTKVTKTNGSYTYSPIKYWTGGKISFFAYHPYADGTKVNMTYDKNSKGLPTITVNAATADIDFMVSNNNKDKTEGSVPFVFKHALSKLNFTVSNNIAETDKNTTITVTNITLSGLKTSGTVNLSDATTWTPATDGSDFTITDLNKEFYVIPQAIVSGTITYTVTTTDTNIAGEKVEFTNKNVPITLTKTNVDTWLSNNQYNYTINISLDAVTISAEVGEWTEVPVSVP